MSKLTFASGAGTVTGANFLLETEKTKLLVDCGLVQGKEFCEECNYGDFSYKPDEITALIITHAHLDHIGRVPRLVARGLKASIISTPPTREIAEEMFADGLKIMKEDEEKYGRKPLYSEEDVAKTLSLWKTHEYHEVFSIDDIQVQFLNAGHILGSAMVECTRNDKKLLFTGDLGNSPAPVVADTEPISGINYMVMESVYGDRLHEQVDERLNFLKELIEETRKKKGTLLIPAFSLQRTQAILHDLNHLVDEGTVEPIDTYLDAPLAIKMLDIYKAYPEYFNAHIQERIAAGDDPFVFARLSLIADGRESKKIAKTPGPKIIIAGSGMSHGGRIREHERTFLGDPSTTLLFIGYQAAGTLGRRLLEGEKKVRIDDDWVKVRAKIARIQGYSAHKDRDQLMSFVEQTAGSLEGVFVAMGEPRSSLFLAQRLNDFFGVNAVAPDSGQSFEIKF